MLFISNVSQTSDAPTPGIGDISHARKVTNLTMPRKDVTSLSLIPAGGLEREKRACDMADCEKKEVSQPCRWHSTK